MTDNISLTFNFARDMSPKGHKTSKILGNFISVHHCFFRYHTNKQFIKMNLRLIKANMHETFLHFSKYILSEKGKIERSNCESKVRSISGLRVASHFPSS